MPKISSKKNPMSASHLLMQAYFSGASGKLTALHITLYLGFD